VRKGTASFAPQDGQVPSPCRASTSGTPWYRRWTKVDRVAESGQQHVSSNLFVEATMSGDATIDPRTLVAMVYVIKQPAIQELSKIPPKT
jgi:hypothetical protein